MDLIRFCPLPSRPETIRSRLTACSWLPILLLAAGLAGCGLVAQAPGPSPDTASSSSLDSLEELGRQLYFDPNLSRNRTQSCATCHVPDAGFIDPRDNGVNSAVSLGDDGKSLGVRNAPTASYARFSPAFQQAADGKYLGGQFLDGRARDLTEQASEPPLNPIEMAMPDRASVVQRLQENADYRRAFQQFFGANILADSDAAYAAMTQAIAAFEQTDFFAPFDSRYDRFLRGEEKLSAQERLGMTLFFSQQFTNCNLCHQLNRSQGSAQETFSNYQFHNIGVPQNPQLPTVTRDAPDTGLLQNPRVIDPAQAGKFKVPSLRNVALTAPYMHNGVFKDLRTVVLFYNKYNSRSEPRQINPETGSHWAAPEVAENISLQELETGPALDDQRIDALVAFMKTLTDRRYESMLVE